MRQIIIKYDGECKRCGKALEIGVEAMYEKSMGCFCIGCEPKDTEEIRHYRQLKADIKAEKYNEWAEKREQKAEAQLNSYPDIRGDIAFNTQPGHIPFRERMNKADDKAYESLHKAKEMRDKAESLSHVRVKGDAERKRETQRQHLDTLISVGSRVIEVFFGAGTVKRINKKTYTIQFDSGGTYAREKTFVRPVKEAI